MKKSNFLRATAFCAVFVIVSAHNNKNSLPAMGLLTMGIDTYKAHEQYAAAIGLQAYVYGLPLYTMQETMEKMTSGKSKRPGSAPLGIFGHATRLIGPHDTFIVTPNNDTLYSSAWINVAKEPYVLHIPEIKNRYYSFCLLDSWTNVFSILGSRTRGAMEGNYLIVDKDWKGSMPDKVEKIVAPTNLVWILVRTLVTDASDVKNVIALQKQFGLTPLSMYLKTGKFEVVPATLEERYNTGSEIPKSEIPKSEIPKSEIPKDLKFFDRLGHYLKGTPPLPDEKALVSWFKEVGITPYGLTLDKIDQATTIGLASSIKTAQEVINAYIKDNGVVKNGWSFFLIPQGYGEQFLMRAAVTYKGFAALPSEEALYMMAEKDVKGEKLLGKHNYMIHFDKANLPPVNAFWSITMYDEKTFNLVKNSINRYSIGDRTKGIHYNEDGSLDIYIQHEKPGAPDDKPYVQHEKPGTYDRKPEERESNWLPAPRGDFYLILRLYNPKKSVFELTWEPPLIQKRD